MNQGREVRWDGLRDPQENTVGVGQEKTAASVLLPS